MFADPGWSGSLSPEHSPPSDSYHGRDIEPAGPQRCVARVWELNQPPSVPPHQDLLLLRRKKERARLQFFGVEVTRTPQRQMARLVTVEEASPQVQVEPTTPAATARFQDPNAFSPASPAQSLINIAKETVSELLGQNDRTPLSLTYENKREISDSTLLDNSTVHAEAPPDASQDANSSRFSVDFEVAKSILSDVIKKISCENQVEVQEDPSGNAVKTLSVNCGDQVDMHEDPCGNETLKSLLLSVTSEDIDDSEWLSAAGSDDGDKRDRPEGNSAGFGDVLKCLDDQRNIAQCLSEKLENCKNYFNEEMLEGMIQFNPGPPAILNGPLCGCYCHSQLNHPDDVPEVPLLCLPNSPADDPTNDDTPMNSSVAYSDVDSLPSDGDDNTYTVPAPSRTSSPHPTTPIPPLNTPSRQTAFQIVILTPRKKEIFINYGDPEDCSTFSVYPSDEGDPQCGAAEVTSPRQISSPLRSPLPSIQEEEE